MSSKVVFDDKLLGQCDFKCCSIDGSLALLKMSLNAQILPLRTQCMLHLAQLRQAAAEFLVGLLQRSCCRLDYWGRSETQSWLVPHSLLPERLQKFLILQSWHMLVSKQHCDLLKQTIPVHILALCIVALRNAGEHVRPLQSCKMQWMS